MVVEFAEGDETARLVEDEGSTELGGPDTVGAAGGDEVGVEIETSKLVCEAFPVELL